MQLNLFLQRFGSGKRDMKVLDLFSGMGGFSLGFKKQGFEIRGADIDPHCVSTFRHNVGPCLKQDLRNHLFDAENMQADILLGSPPCRPWSRLNLHIERKEHPDRPLIQAFEKAVLGLRPRIFIMENVPLLERDDLFRQMLERARDAGYSCEPQKICYAKFGAATKRKRLFLFGVLGGDIRQLLTILDTGEEEARTVWDVIASYSGVGPGEISDHEWPDLRTIERYLDKYRTKRYGWYCLEKESPAPSFGNINKTYILHPDSLKNGAAPRVLSIREAMAIMGFNDDFRFPPNVPVTARYRMISDAVSPVFSEKCAHAVKQFLSQQ